eukprot:TRINITY_DN23527_c0_g1_i1.p1 TRINITY_DN23527_c0_g1~~TRINITY_DN23527_c0_g1_i1.p1  ORF type:complete len:368 (-),score=120.57 TRINITY_DN23527_c0_g1_i1:233-1336(-)
MTSRANVFNFAAGPACLPESVLLEIQRNLLDYNGSGMSVLEMSHRSKPFEQILKRAEDDLRALLRIPESYKVLFLQGGGTGQFAAVPLNLFGDKKSADYLITGAWSKKAAEEARRYGAVKIAASSEKDNFSRVPARDTWTLDPEAAYLYYCGNETVHGVEFEAAPEGVPGVPLVADLSSNFLSRPVDISKHGVVYAGAQKNSGIAGVTVVIIREDLLKKPHSLTPTVLDYKIYAENDSMYNTPPTFSIYVAGLMYRWLLDQGGLEAVERANIAKSNLIYDVIDESDFYRCPVEKPYRSRMNVTIRLKDPTLEPRFINEASARGMLELQGHRSVGGIRASLYNAMPLDGVRALRDFMVDFRARHVQHQ